MEKQTVTRPEKTLKFSWDKEGVVARHADKILERTATELRETSNRIRRNIQFKLPCLADLYAGSEAIAVAEIGERYCVVDCGSRTDVEKRMGIRTSSAGDLNSVNYEIFRLGIVPRSGYNLKDLGRLARLNEARASA
jgi:hypothetical protein